MAKSRMAGDKLKDSTPNEHEVAGMTNYNNENYATDNQYGQDLSGIKYKEGISEHFGGDGSIGENDIKRMMDAGYSSDDVYNFSKKKGLNYNQHGQKYMKGQGSYEIGKGSDQWGDVFGSSSGGGSGVDTTMPVDGGGGDDSGGDVSTMPVTTIPAINTGSGDITMPDPAPGIGDPYGGGTVIQDNDQVSSVIGNNNTVNQAQDNRVNQFGDARSFKDMWMQDFFN